MNVIRFIIKIHSQLGRHEGNYIALTQLAIMAYETMRPRHACVVDVLAQVRKISVCLELNLSRMYSVTWVQYLS